MNCRHALRSAALVLFVTIVAGFSSASAQDSDLGGLVVTVADATGAVIDDATVALVRGTIAGRHAPRTEWHASSVSCPAPGS